MGLLLIPAWHALAETEPGQAAAYAVEEFYDGHFGSTYDLEEKTVAQIIEMQGNPTSAKEIELANAFFETAACLETMIEKMVAYDRQVEKYWLNVKNEALYPNLSTFTEKFPIPYFTNTYEAGASAVIPFTEEEMGKFKLQDAKSTDAVLWKINTYAQAINKALFIAVYVDPDPDTSGGAGMAIPALEPLSYWVEKKFYSLSNEKLTSEQIKSLSSLLHGVHIHFVDIVQCIYSVDAAYKKWQAEYAKLVEEADEEIERLSEEAADIEEEDPEAAAELREKAAQLETLKETENVAIYDQALDPDKVLFREQCFLLAKMPALAAVHLAHDIAQQSSGCGAGGHTAQKRLPYYDSELNASLLIEGQPFAFINKLTQYSTQANFFNMETSELSNLVPMIRLFKVDLKKNSATEEIETEFNFDSAATSKDVTTFFTNKAKRGFGVGIKNFSFTYEGTDPFSAKRSISAKLHLFANNFDELFEERGGYRYVDLALKTGTETMGRNAKEDACYQNQQNLNKLNFRLKALVGWAIPNRRPSTLSAEVRDALYNSYVTLNLTPTIHDFAVDDQGRVNFTINYLAYTENFFDQREFNIFADPKIITPNIIKRRLRYKLLENQCGQNEVSAAAKNLAEVKKQDAVAIRNDKIKSLGTLLRELVLNDKIYYIPLTRQQLREFIVQGPVFDWVVPAPNVMKSGNFLGQLKDALESAASPTEGDPGALNSEALKFSLAVDNPNEENLSFFYLGDLVDIILAKIGLTLKEVPGMLKENLDPSQYNKEDLQQEVETLQRFEQNFERFRVVLGPIELVNQQNNEATTASLGDIPISVKYFMEWLTSKISAKDQVGYTLSAFLTDITQNLLRNFMNDDGCFDFSTKQKIILNTAVVTSYKDTDYDEVTQAIIEQGGDTKRLFIDNYDIATHKKPLLNIAGEFMRPGGDKGVMHQTNYLIYSAGRLQPPQLMQGNRSIDEAAGIFHYMIGKRKGIVKTINLTKTEATGLKEVRWEQEGYDGLQQLREVYNVEVNTFANVNTFPGTYIYVDPQGFAPNTTTDGGVLDLTQYGIGGYHMIIRSTHTFGEGKADSQLTAQWVAQLESEDICRQNPSGVGDNSATKCRVSLTDALGESATDPAAEAAYLESRLGESAVDEVSAADQRDGAGTSW